MVGRAIRDSFVKLAPRQQIQNPVMFLVYLSAILTSILFVLSLCGISDGLTATLWKCASGTGSSSISAVLMSATSLNIAISSGRL